MSALDEMLSHILGDAARVAYAAKEFAKTAVEVGLDTPGAGLLALGHRSRFFLQETLHTEGRVTPTLWMFDGDTRQWAFGSDFMSTEDDEQASGNWSTMALLFRKSDAIAYILMQQSVSVKVDRGLTRKERQRLRDDPAECTEVAVIFGESIDGGGLMMSYRISEAGQIDIDTPLSMLFGRKDKWPGPHGAAYTDHGFPELLPLSEPGRWPRKAPA